MDTLSAPDPENVQKGSSAKDEFNSLVQCILLRARDNPQRHYEVYTIGMSAGVTEEDIKQMFDGDSAQHMVNLIRNKGTKYFSDRANLQKVKII